MKKRYKTCEEQKKQKTLSNAPVKKAKKCGCGCGCAKKLKKTEAPCEPKLKCDIETMKEKMV